MSAPQSINYFYNNIIIYNLILYEGFDKINRNIKIRFGLEPGKRNSFNEN